MNAEDRNSQEAAVGEVLMMLGRAFATNDASGLDGIYAEDADWVNAFGTRIHGREAIVHYLEKLFADQRFKAGRMVGKPQSSIRFLADGSVAVARTYVEREGQQTVDGGELPLRRNHSLKVLEKQAGRWLIVSEMYMDARDEQTLAVS